MDEANYVWQRAMVTLEKLSTDTNDYRILGIRAQVLLHLGLEKEANPIIERLTEMGYAEPAIMPKRCAREEGYRRAWFNKSERGERGEESCSAIAAWHQSIESTLIECARFSRA